jgi:hypothetical protein
VPVRTVEVPDAEVITTAKLWPAGWVGVLVLDVTPALDEPDLQVRVAPVAVAPARRVGAAAVRVALAAEAVGAPGRTAVPDGEVITPAKAWPAGWGGVLVVGVTPGLDGFVALGLTRGQPVEVVVAGDVVVAIVAAAAIPLDNTAPFLGPAPLSLGTKAEAA